MCHLPIGLRTPGGCCAGPRVAGALGTGGGEDLVRPARDRRGETATRPSLERGMKGPETGLMVDED